MKFKLRVNQTVCVAHTWRKPHTYRDVVVDKIGRKWASCNDGRLFIDLKTGVVYDASKQWAHGEVWPSKEVYEAARALQKEWRELVNKLNAMDLPAPGVTAETIGKAGELLGL